MNIRFLIPVVLLAIASTYASAADAWARLHYQDGSKDDVYIVKYDKGFVTYKLNLRALNFVKVGPDKIEAIYFYQPNDYVEAIELYRGRKYSEARERFAAVEQAYKAVDTAPNNYATLSGFYKLECSRRMMDLDTLSRDQERFRSKGLTRESHLQQLEVNSFWEAVRLKDWVRLDRLAQAWRKRKVPGGQRVQIAYCHGLALENLAKKNPKLLTDALNAYNVVLTADFTASNELVIKAANSVLSLYAADSAVKLAIRLWKTQDENPNSAGYQRLLEANTLVKLYKQAGLDTVLPLKPEYEKFLKYEVKVPGEE